MGKIKTAFNRLTRGKNFDIDKGRRSIFGSLTKVQKIVLAILIIGITAGGVWFFSKKDDSNNSGRKVVYEAKDPPIKFGEPAFKVPKNAKSSVCTKLSAKDVENITKEKNNGAKVTIPDTKTSDGSVAACNYTTVNSRTAKDIRSVSVTIRTLSSEKLARENFTKIAKLAKDTDDDIVFKKESNQAIAIKGAKLISIDIIKIPDSKAPVEAMAKSIVSKL